MFCIQLVDVIESSLGIPEIMGVGVDHLLSVVQEVEVELNTAHDSPTHSRFGYRSSWCCSECNEFLCKRKRWTKTGNLVEVGWKENSQREKAELSCYEVCMAYFQCASNYSH